MPVYPVPDLANEGDLDNIESELLPFAGSNTGVIFAVENDYDGDWDEDGELDDGAGESDDDGETYDRSSQSQISRAEMFDRGPEVDADGWLINAPGAASVNAAQAARGKQLPDNATRCRYAVHKMSNTTVHKTE